MTFGEGCRPARTYSAVLEDALGARVCNAGVPGYSSAQMLGRLRRFLPVLHPGGDHDPLPHLGPPALRHPLRLQGRLHRGGRVRRPPAPARRQPLPARDPAPRPRHRDRLRRALLEPAAARPPRPRQAGHRALQRREEEPRAGRRRADRPQPAGRGSGWPARPAPASWPSSSTTGDRIPARPQGAPGTPRRAGCPLGGRRRPAPDASWDKLSYPIDGHWNAAGHQQIGQALAPRIKPLLAAR